MVQVVDDQLRQIRVVGPAKTRQQMAPPIRIQIGAGQPVERRVLEAFEILKPSQSLFRQPLAGRSQPDPTQWADPAFWPTVSRW
jgi:hypothetical protein